MDLENQSPRRESTSFSLGREDEGPLLKRTLSPEDEAPNRGIDPRIIADATIGLSDGLTVPFALTAGLSALGSTRVVIFGGLAELIAGMISMGVGGYLGSKSEVESYSSKLKCTKNLIKSSPATANALVKQAMAPYDLSDNILDALATQLSYSEDRQLDFIMKFTNEMQPPACNRAYISAFTIALGYFVGGFIPLVPYFFAADVRTAFWWSVAVMVVALFTFGFLKRLLVESEDSDYISWNRKLLRRGRSGVEMILLGGIAAGAAMGFVRALDP